MNVRFCEDYMTSLAIQAFIVQLIYKNRVSTFSIVEGVHILSQIVKLFCKLKEKNIMRQYDNGEQCNIA